MNCQDGQAIGFSLSHVFVAVKDFINGYVPEEEIKKKMVDYADENDAGIVAALGNEFLSKVIWGCKFHWLQSASRVQRLACESSDQAGSFMWLCR